MSLLLFWNGTTGGGTAPTVADIGKIYVAEKLSSWVYYIDLSALDDRYNVQGSYQDIGINTTTESYVVGATDSAIMADATDGNITVTLPAVATNKGRLLTIKKIDSSANTVTIDGSGSETIDGDTTKVISSQYDSITIISDGSAWYIQ